MKIVVEPCENCRQLFCYIHVTKRRTYCDGCIPIVRAKSNAVTQRMRDKRFGRNGRGSIRGRLAQLERQGA